MLQALFPVALAAPPFLAELAILLLAGAAIGYVCHRFGLVPIVGFLVTGVVIGPSVLHLVKNKELVDQAAEIGVILLLFMIGIEFSLEKLAEIKKLIFVGGGLQVGLATALVVALLLPFGVDWRVGLYTGFLVALSSTAIVLKLLGDRGETGDDHGRIGLGFLIFQDLGIIVMVLLIPILGGEGGSSGDILFALGKALVLIVVVLTVARKLMPPILERVARTCSQEIFLLTVVAICFGTAYLTSLAGVSVSLGAFLAGLLVSESEFSHHAFGELLPLRTLFAATFFISVGMLLDLGFLIQNLPLVLGVLVAVFLIKVATTAVAARVLGFGLPAVATSSLMLAQIGEFSFVLERAGRDAGLTPAGMAEVGSQSFIAATVVLMVLTPALLDLGQKLGRRLERRQAETALSEAGPPPPTELTDHVLVAGYGRAARRLVRALDAAETPYLITTLSPGGAREAEAEGRAVMRGDASKLMLLESAGLRTARLLVVPDDEPEMAERITAVARGARRDLAILARTRFAVDAPELAEAGADGVVTEEIASSVALVRETFDRLGTSPEVVEHAVETARTCTTLDIPTPRSGIPGRNRTVVDVEAPVTLEISISPERCAHTADLGPVLPRTRGCEECLAAGYEDWQHLRVCMTCGHVGCCDSSKERHASRHHAATGHPVMRSVEPGETWGWCFEDEVEL